MDAEVWPQALGLCDWCWQRVARQEAKQTVALNRGYKSVLDPEDSKRGYHAAPADSSSLKETASQYTQRMLSAARYHTD